MATYSNDELRKIYEGDTPTHFAIMKARFVEGDADMSSRNFDTENHIKSIIDARVFVTPNTFDVDAGEDTATKALLEWLEMPVFGGGQNFWENQLRWNLDLEIYGHIYLQFFDRKGVLNINQFPPPLEIKVITSEFNVDDIQEYLIKIDPSTERRREGTREEKIGQRGEKRIIFNEDGVRTEGFGASENVPRVANETNGLLQVQRIRRIPRSNSPYGIGGVEELIESQISISFYTMCNFQAVKYGAFGMFTPPKGMSEDEWKLWLDAYKSDSSHKIYPGALKLYPLENIAGNPFINEIDTLTMRKVDHIYQIGKVPRKKENMDLRSGKAMLFASHDLRIYTEMKTRSLARQWEKLFAKWFVLSGRIEDLDEAEITVTYPSFELQDASETKVSSDSLKELHDDGVITGATRLKEVVKLGIVDEDTDVAAETQAAEDEKAASGVNFGQGPFGAAPPGQEAEKPPADITEEEPEEEEEVNA